MCLSPSLRAQEEPFLTLSLNGGDDVPYKDRRNQGVLDEAFVT